jgi:hypothetical protein
MCRYGRGEDRDLARHMDLSEVTLNVCLLSSSNRTKVS